MNKTLAKEITSYTILAAFSSVMPRDVSILPDLQSDLQAINLFEDSELKNAAVELVTYAIYQTTDPTEVNATKLHSAREKVADILMK